jgi:Sigma-70, region 4
MPAGELPETVIADFADGRVLGAQVRRALQALPQPQRNVLVLRYCLDLPGADVADLLVALPEQSRRMRPAACEPCARSSGRTTMNDAEAEARRLLAAATEDMPRGSTC